jgi:hypothetical protein
MDRPNKPACSLQDAAKPGKPGWLDGSGAEAG